MNPYGSYDPEIMGRVTDYIMYHAGTDSFVRHDLNMLLLEMLGYTLLTLVVGYFTARFVAISAMGFGANMRSAIFNKVQDLSFDNIDKFKVGSLITRTISDTARIQSLFSTTLSVFLKGPIMLGVALKKSISISSDMSKMFYYAVPGIVITLVALGMLAVPLFKAMLGKMDTFNGTLRGNISGMRVVKAFVREDYERAQFEKINTDVAKANIRAQSLIIYISPIIIFIMYGCMIFSLRQSCASAIAARFSAPPCISSFASNRSHSVNASATEPAVTTEPAGTGLSQRMPKPGSSWISIPTPWPRPWP